MAYQYHDIQTVDTTTFPFILEHNVTVPLGNGGVIRCNVYKPKATLTGTRFPVLMTYGPYGKDVPYKQYVELSIASVSSANPVEQKIQRDELFRSGSSASNRAFGVGDSNASVLDKPW
ncbi:hypothetical protein F66182_16117, partial [Fusarium sp. NRRL 66182]